MANPLKDEGKIYERIKQEGITIHPILWELMNHHVKNDLNYISLVLCDILYPTPRWILKSAQFTINILYKISFSKRETSLNN